jgi:hypothetical protein
VAVHIPTRSRFQVVLVRLVVTLLTWLLNTLTLFGLPKINYAT